MINILIDTQEKLPYTFSTNTFSTKRCSLPTGDYIIEDRPKGAVIERKSLDDFVKSIQEDRFYRELERLQEFEMPLIVVEADFPSILIRKYAGPLPPSEVVKRSVKIIKEYKIPIIYCTDRQHAIYFVEQVFQEYSINHRPRPSGGTEKKQKKKQKEEDIL